jgi:hypothetical protein
VKLIEARTEIERLRGCDLASGRAAPAGGKVLLALPAGPVAVRTTPKSGSASPVLVGHDVTRVGGLKNYCNLGRRWHRQHRQVWSWSGSVTSTILGALSSPRARFRESHGVPRDDHCLFEMTGFGVVLAPVGADVLVGG